MKYILVLLLFPLNSFAIGKLTLRQPLISKQDNLSTELGLYVNENLTGDTYYQSWTGGQFGESFTTNHEILNKITPKLDVGVGGSIRNNYSRTDSEIFGGIVVEYKLWD